MRRLYHSVLWQARGAIRDVGRVLAIPYATVDSVAKLVPMELKVTIDSALKASPELRHRYEEDEQTKKLLDIAKSIEGMPRHATMHAAGVVITDRPRYLIMFRFQKMMTMW